MTTIGTGGLFVVAPGAGETVWFLGTRVTLKVAGEQVSGAFGLIEQTSPPGFATPLHVHSHEDEAFYIIDGQFTFTCGEDTLTAAPGAFVFLPRDIPHSFRVTGDTPGHLLQLNTPGGLERGFIEAGDPVEHHRTPPPPDPARLEAITVKYGTKTLGPPPGED